jgi:hypothetical protein
MFAVGMILFFFFFFLDFLDLKKMNDTWTNIARSNFTFNHGVHIMDYKP